jgi:glycolate oxidase iron-sulfur subunit
VDIGRAIVEERVPRPGPERALRLALREGLTSSGFAPAMKLGQFFRPFLPGPLKDKVPARGSPRAALWPARAHKRKVLLLLGCVQPSMLPNINSATARVLDAVGIQTLVADDAGCCGAIRTHLADVRGGLADMRRNIDAWWPLVDGLTSEGKVEAIVMSASGCGVTVKDYAHALAHDPQYADKARRVSELTRDLSEFLPEIAEKLAGRVHGTKGKVLAWHPPCTLQHGQQLRGGVETALRALGFDVRLAAEESHLCCGSAGTYSVLQPALAKALRQRKLAHLAADDLHRADAPDVVISANIGCIQHLQSGSPLRVAHWVEVLDEVLA